MITEDCKMDKIVNQNRMCVTRKELPQYLGCGLYTADRIARKAGARIKVGNRVLIYLPKVEAYLAGQTE